MRFYSVYVSHVSICNWVKRFSHIFKNISNFFLSKLKICSKRWHVDETYIKIKGVNHYLWFLFDAKTKVIISFNLPSQRDSNNALKLIEKSRSVSY